MKHYSSFEKKMFGKHFRNAPVLPVITKEFDPGSAMPVVIIVAVLEVVSVARAETISIDRHAKANHKFFALCSYLLYAVTACSSASFDSRECYPTPSPETGTYVYSSHEIGSCSRCAIMQLAHSQ